MSAEVTMPKLTDSMEEGRLVGWKVAPGDAVAEGDVIAEIETDKAVMELESFWVGTVDALVREAGDVVRVGEVIARIRDAKGGTARETTAEIPAQQEERLAAAEKAAPRRGKEVPGGEGAKELTPQQPKAPAPKDVGQKETAVPLPGAHPLSERGGRESPRPAPPELKVPESLPSATGSVGKLTSAGVRASPRARKLARERGIELSAITGTGPEGRVLTADVEAAARGESQRTRRGVGAAPADEELPPVSFSADEAEVEEVSFYQRAAIRRVVASKHVIPHFYVSRTVRAEALLAKKAAEKDRSGATLTHFLLRACALALERHPVANRSYDRGRWIRWKSVNLGLAIQTDAGLVVGVLRDAAGKDLAWISRETRELVDRARAGKLGARERSNATFTLSSLGVYDVESFSAIINPPSALTLAVGTVAPAAVVEAGALKVAPVMHLTLSCDHRTVDGVAASQFLSELGRLLERPEEL